MGGAAGGVALLAVVIATAVCLRRRRAPGSPTTYLDERLNDVTSEKAKNRYSTFESDLKDKQELERGHQGELTFGLQPVGSMMRFGVDDVVGRAGGINNEGYDFISEDTESSFL